jgi:hypothetical protein
MFKLATFTIALAALSMLPAAIRAAPPAEQPLVDFSRAQVVVPAGLNGPEKKAVAMLVEEIAARTRLHLPVVESWPDDAATPVIAVGPASTAAKFAGPLAAELEGAQPLAAEGFRIIARGSENATAVVVAGADARGVLFGVGKLLRSLEMRRDRLELRLPLDVTAAPAMAVRGHQLGFRPKTNSYDAWDLPQWEQYIRDLTVFGCNSIELIPPRSDDDADSPHFPRPPLEMMIGMSQIAADYGLDVWIWQPAMELGYPTPQSIEAAVAEWGAVLEKLPRVNALFVPSGDPGDASPRELMAMLAAQAPQLERLHPGARIWISLQGFTQEQFDDMLELLRAEPPWLAGVVHGPQTRLSVAELREALPARYAIRGYPDITHSMRCEYPVPNWDLAYALTEGRETINPRPLDESIIFRQYQGRVQGVISYSEGCNDDVNKAVWSRLSWDAESRPIDTLRDYGRYFIGADYADDFAQGLLALERNWRGPLLANEGVERTLAQLQAMEREAPPRVRRNWRFQQALYRAYYDAYQRARLLAATADEAEVMAILADARRLGPARAMDLAEAALDRAADGGRCSALAARVNELAEALFQSIGMQLSVEKYAAIDVNRGANLDELHAPLNNRGWLKDRFTALRALGEEAQQRGLDELLAWTDPGPGGHYDDLGDPMAQPHLVQTTPYADDPGFLATPYVGFYAEPQWRRSWCTHVDGLYGTPIVMHYDQLDPRAQYKVRVVYGGFETEARVRLVARGAADSAGQAPDAEVHPYQLKPQPVRPVEFNIPRAVTRGGEVTLTWQSNPERGGPGRGCQIAEVWLIKSPQAPPPAK